MVALARHLKARILQDDVGDALRLELYHPIDERVPRVRQLPDGQLVPIKDLYTAEELKTSRAYNEALLRGKYQQGLNVRLNGPDPGGQ